MKKSAIFLFVLLSFSVSPLLGQQSNSGKNIKQPMRNGSSMRLMNNTYHNLAGGNFSQNWSTTTLITANDDWSAVPSIIGFLGNYDLTGSPTGVDPQTLLTQGSTDPDGLIGDQQDVIANQANPNTNTAGGVAEFDGIANPSVALQGSGTADAPGIVLYMNTTGRQNVVVSFNARDLDGSADNATQQIAVHYRVGTSGNFINLPSGYIPDATTGPNIATLATPVSITLPAAAENQAQVQIRILTTNAPGSDEWVGIDDITVTSDPAGFPPFTGAPSGVINGTTYSDVTFTSGGSFPTNAAITVNGTLTLGGNVIDLNGGSITVANNSETAIVATPGVGRINGALTRAIAVSGSPTTYAFPLGDATRNRGVIVGFATTTGTTPSLTALFDGTNPGTGGIGSLSPSVANVWPGGFWRVSQTGLTTTAYSIALSTDGVGGILNPSTVRIIKRPNLATNWAESVVSTQVTPVGLTGQQASFATGFSEFGFGGAGDNPLPVELSSFTGNASQNGVRLAWTTQSELNNAGFVVLRNGEEIASYRFSPELRGRGTTAGATNYSFLDGGVETGKSYTYRLRSFDLDGAAHDYAQTVSVEVREPVSARAFSYDLSQNFPNPFNPTTNIKYSVAQSGNVSLKVYDLLGREVLTLVNQVQAPGEYQVSFDASSLAASGMYIYRLQSGSFTRTMKMMLVK